jgi:DNA-binding response OmpR family regulator
VRSRGRALSRDAILDEVWGRGLYVDPRTVDNFVSSLKKKLRWTRTDPWRIETVRGVGYRYDGEG